MPIWFARLTLAIVGLPRAAKWFFYTFVFMLFLFALLRAPLLNTLVGALQVAFWVSVGLAAADIVRARQGRRR
jgi:hypothetical protein